MAAVKRRKRIVIILIIILVVLLIMTAAFGFYGAGYSLNIRRQTLEEARTWQENHYDLSWYDPLEKTDYTVTSYDGYVLHAQFLPNPDRSSKYIIISHGYSDNRFGALKYAKMYLDLGFNIIAYDLRGHGGSVRDVRIAVLEEKPPVDFVVADCGFSEIASVLRNGMQAMHLPGFLTGIMSIGAKIRFGYSYEDMKPIDSLKDNRIPILFIHGGSDSFVLPENSEKMKEATPGYAELHLIPNVDHAMSVISEPEQYREIVSAFLEKITDQ